MHRHLTKAMQLLMNAEIHMVHKCAVSTVACCYLRPINRQERRDNHRTCGRPRLTVLPAAQYLRLLDCQQMQ